MSNNKKILILNTGGTFNKVYDEINGKLIVPKNNNAIENILINSKINNVSCRGLVYKDSLDITKDDRKQLKNIILESNYTKIIIVHGTDTIDKTAKYLNKYIKNKTIILTASMIPYSIDKSEATSNFMLAYGYLLSIKKHKIYISMHGNVQKYKQLIKNRALGVFECQK